MTVTTIDNVKANVMALFEFEQGRLIPAQFGRPVEQGLDPEVLQAIRSQVLEIIGRPLFPVTWQTDDDGSAEAAGSHRLTALDASGQVVSVELMTRLDPVSLIGALARLGDSAILGWLDLAQRFPGGPDAFRAGWAEFREQMPPTIQPGPRLIIVTGDIDPAIRPALGVLYQSSMEIHEIRLRQMSNGRRFLEVIPLRAETINEGRGLPAGTHSAEVPQLGWAESGNEVAPEPVHDEPAPAAYEQPADEFVPDVAPQAPEPEAPAPEAEVPMPEAPAPEAPGPEAPAPEAPAYTEPIPEPTPQQGIPVAEGVDLPDETVQVPSGDRGEIYDEPQAVHDQVPEASEVADADTAPAPEAPAPETSTSHAPGEHEDDSQHVADLPPVPGVLGFNAEGIQAIAAVIGQDAVLVSRDADGRYYEALLRSDGMIDCGNGFVTDDVEQAYHSVSGKGDVVAWQTWRIGHVEGPTLAEAIDEINAEIYRESQEAYERHHQQ